MANDGGWTRCWKCKVQYFLPPELYTAAKSSENISFFCPYGHSAHYPKGEHPQVTLRRERDRLLQRLAQRDDVISLEREAHQGTKHQLRAQKGVVTRIKNRVGHGVCPCCSRTFVNLGRHMETKHPDYAKGDVVLRVVK